MRSRRLVQPGGSSGLLRTRACAALVRPPRKRQLVLLRGVRRARSLNGSDGLARGTPIWPHWGSLPLFHRSMQDSCCAPQPTAGRYLGAGAGIRSIIMGIMASIICIRFSII